MHYPFVLRGRESHHNKEFPSPTAPLMAKVPGFMLTFGAGYNRYLFP